MSYKLVENGTKELPISTTSEIGRTFVVLMGEMGVGNTYEIQPQNGAVITGGATSFVPRPTGGFDDEVYTKIRP